QLLVHGRQRARQAARVHALHRRTSPIHRGLQRRRRRQLPRLHPDPGGRSGAGAVGVTHVTCAWPTWQADISDATRGEPLRPAASVQTLQVTFVDRSRGTDATESAPAQDQRVLATTITYPVGIKGPVPLVVLAHGNSGNPSKFSQLIGAWAAAHYVVAAPVFP